MEHGHLTNRQSTAHSRELGAYLRTVRRRSGISFKDMVTTLGWSAGKLTKLETGTRGTSRDDIFFLLGICNADKSTRDQVTALAEMTDTGNFLRLHDHSADHLPGLRVHEDQATAVTAYDPIGIPDLAQTADYALALTGDEDVVTTRLTRQRRLMTSATRGMTLFIREVALGTSVGSTEVMQEQLLYLTLLAGTANTVVRVIPEARGLHTALRHPATLLIPEPPHQPVVHVETDAATVFHDDPVVVATYEEKFRQLNRLALGPGDSKKLLARCADRYDAKAS
ncbi:helix-turn-helix domain-containing protein [Saccharothrix syringae]|uniref:XRE family transcriptional regulator n=2 Tax=Saccharothrix syringae TaxID=103733 RepID=A0A5Q0GV48_SACSY|nr:helix-turn-helix transcriptional regulator [Saccharothrix syringae]QFZ17374.1 XRE family transcriptional regulator [Saccharothrix syringae]